MGTIQKDVSVKETFELSPIRHACSFAFTILKAAEELIVRNVSNRWEINDQLSKELFDYLSLEFSKVENLQGYLPEDIDFCYPPKIEGGHYFNQYLKTNTEWKDFGFDIITYFAGVKLKNHCCLFVRPLLFRSTKRVHENYDFVKSVNEQVIKNLRDGIALSIVYERVRSFAEQENKSLANLLEDEFGFELGPNFKNESVVINSKSKILAQKGMIFAININLIGLKEENKEYSIYHSDTVYVRVNDQARILTHYLPININLSPRSPTESIVQDRAT